MFEEMISDMIELIINSVDVVYSYIEYLFKIDYAVELVAISSGLGLVWYGVKFLMRLIPFFDEKDDRYEETNYNKNSGLTSYDIYLIENKKEYDDYMAIGKEMIDENI